jgi:hypothetical protein
MFLDCLEKTHSPISELVSAKQQPKILQKMQHEDLFESVVTIIFKIFFILKRIKIIIFLLFFKNYF